MSVGAVVATSAPTYSNGTSQSLSLTTAGALRVDASATTQPVSIAAGTNSIGTVVAPTITIGTQSSTGFMVQNAKDAGRTPRSFFTLKAIVTTATDTLQSLTGYNNGSSVTATTTPAVVSTGKRFRVTSISLTYVAIATAGYAVVTLRANTSGTVVIGSPAVCNWSIGATAATAGVAQQMNVPIPDGLEFAAGTGIGISVCGYGATGTAAAVGYVHVSLQGFEY